MSALLRHLLPCFAVVLGLLQATCAFADALPEYTVKAGYLYNFALLTEWPSDTASKSLEVCLIGNDDFLPALQTLQGKMVNERRINIHMLAQPGDAKECNVLFIAEIDRAEFLLLKHEIAGLPILTVTDNENLTKSGISITLRPEHQRLAFTIDTNIAKAAKLNVSARLLRLSQ